MRISNPKDMGGNKLLHRVNVATGGVIQGEGTETSPLVANVDAIASNVFPAFSGNSGKVLRVNANETGTEWAEMMSTSGKVETVRYVSSVEDYEAICSLASSAGSGGVVPFVALNDIDLESDDVFDQGTETVSCSLKRGHTYIRIDAEFTIYFPSESGGTTHTRTVHTTTYLIHKFWLVNNSTGSHVDNWALRAWRGDRNILADNAVAIAAGFGYGYGWKNRTEVYDYIHWLMNGMWPTVEVHERPESQEASLMADLEVDGTYLGTNPDDLTSSGTNGATLKRIAGVWRKGNISRDSHMNLVEYFDMDTSYSIQFMYRTSSGSSSTIAKPMSTMEVTETWKTGAFEIPEKLIHLPLQLTGDITPGLPRKADEVAYAAALEVHPGDCLSVSLAGNMTISALGGVDGVRQTASIDIMPGTYSVTAGQNLAIIGSLTVDKLNHCEIRWWGKEATLHALYVENATSGGESSSSSSGSEEPAPSDGWPTKIVVSNATSAQGRDVSAYNGEYTRTGGTLSILGEDVPIWSNGSKYIYGMSSSMGSGLNEPAIALQDATGENDAYMSYYYRMKSESSWKRADAANAIEMTATITEDYTSGGESSSSSSSESSSSSGTTEGTITTSSQTITGTAGTSLSYNLANYVTVSNGQTPTFTLASGQVLPTGLSLSSNGAISGTPEASSSATIRVKVSASNCPDVEMTVTFNIAESTPQGTITVTNNPTISGVVGTAISPYNLSSCVTVSNGMTPSFSWTEAYVSKPSWLTLTETGVLSGTPSSIPSPNAGKVTVSADNCNSAYIDITWDIINAGTITIDNQTIDGTVGNAVSLNLSSSTTVSNGQTPTFTVKSGNTLPAGIELSSAGVLSGTPTVTSSATVVITITARGCPDKEVSITFNITEAQSVSDGFPVSFTVSSVSYQGQSITAPCGTYTRTGEAFPLTASSVAYPVYSYTGSDSKTYYICVVANMFGGDGPAWMLTGTKPTASSVTNALAVRSYGGTTLKSGTYEPADTLWSGNDGSATVSWEMGAGGETPSDGWPTTITVSDATATTADSSWSDEWNGTYTRTGDTTTALGETIPVWSNGKYYVMGYGYDTDFNPALSEVGIGFFTNKNSPYRRSSYYYRAKSATTWTRGAGADGPGLTMTITEDYTSGGESSSSEAGGGTITFPTSFSVTACSGNGAAVGQYTKTSETTTVNSVNYPVYSRYYEILGTTFYVFVCDKFNGASGAYWALNGDSEYSSSMDGNNTLGAVSVGSDGLPSSTTWTAQNNRTATVSWT